MQNRWLIISLFVIVALVQLYVPFKMISDREDTLEFGKEFRFETQPIDPNDPLRGKYIVLYYKNDTYEVENGQDWDYNQAVWVALEEDERGFAKIKNILTERPEDTQDYVKASIGYNNGNVLNIDYPFNRFYMDEFKAPDAEKAYRESRADSTSTAYSVVKVRDGEAVLLDVMIDGVSIKEIAGQMQTIEE